MKRWRIRVVYYGALAFIMVFLLTAMVGIYWSLAGFRDLSGGYARFADISESVC